jgi:Protein of unknown function (DUF1822)
MKSTIHTLSQIYPHHGWIDLSTIELFPSTVPIPNQERTYTFSQVELNQLCLAAVKYWLRGSVDLQIEAVFPCWFQDREQVEFTARLVNGFALQIGQTKVVFIPSEAIDLAEFEIPQEWVDLPNWAADYYVPIQVDLVGGFLHLWSFVTHKDLKYRAELDRIFHNYHLDRVDVVDNLDILWSSCELPQSSAATVSSIQLPEIELLTATMAKQSIEQLDLANPRLSPRLNLPFAKWGAILNNPESLRLYLNHSTHVDQVLKSTTIDRQVANLREWIESGKIALNTGWQSINSLINPPQFNPGYRSTPPQLRSRLIPNHVRGVPLNTPAEIDLAVKLLYHTQDPQHQIVALPTHLHTPTDLLIYLIENTINETLRWQAADYLWSVSTDGQIIGNRAIKDIGLVIQNHSIGLMAAVIATPDKKMAILTRVYPIGTESTLPPNLELSLLDAEGNLAIKQPIVSQTESPNDYIQLHFNASLGTIFSIRVTLNNSSITETFSA